MPKAASLSATIRALISLPSPQYPILDPISSEYILFNRHIIKYILNFLLYLLLILFFLVVISIFQSFFDEE